MFIVLEPKHLSDCRCASFKGAAELGRYGHPEDLPLIDLIVTGCVGAGVDGRRLGKGGGYADLEYGILIECVPSTVTIDG